MSPSPSLVILEAAPGPDDPLGMLKACHRRLEARLATLSRVVWYVVAVPELKNLAILVSIFSAIASPRS